MGKYIAVKIVEAEPMTAETFEMKFERKVVVSNAEANAEGNHPGFCVGYGDGYQSWCPEDQFLAANFPLEDGTKITEDDVVRFIDGPGSTQLDAKTTLVSAETLTGFVCHEVSSCVDPANYDHTLGVKYGTEKIKSKIWGHLGFLLQWGINGLKKGSE